MQCSSVHIVGGDGDGGGVEHASGGVCLAQPVSHPVSEEEEEGAAFLPSSSPSCFVVVLRSTLAAAVNDDLKCATANVERGREVGEVSE